MGWFLGLLSSMFSALSFLIVVGVVVIYVIIRALVGWSQGSSMSASKMSENDEDGSEFCMYGLPYIHQHCSNCDLAEHCMGINFHKREGSNENLWLLDDSLDSRDMDDDERIHIDDEYAYNEGYDDLDEEDDW